LIIYLNLKILIKLQHQLIEKQLHDQLIKNQNEGAFLSINILLRTLNTKFL